MCGSKISVKVQRNANAAQKKGIRPAPPAARLQGPPMPYGVQSGPFPIPFGAQPGHMPVPPGRPGNQSPNPFRFPPKHRTSHDDIDIYNGPPPPPPMPMRSFTELQTTHPITQPVPAIPPVKLLIKVQANPDVRHHPGALHKSLHDVFIKAHVEV